MLDYYISWFDMASKALKYPVENFKTYSFNNIAVLGMGGSGIAGDFIKALGSGRLNIPVHVIKDFNIPKWINSGTLLIAISYSGNTIETIESVKHGIKYNAKIIAISSGGLLEKIALDNCFTYIKVDSGYTPRSAFPLLLYSLLRILLMLDVNIVEEWEINESIDVLKDVNGNIEDARKIANILIDSIPIIIADVRYEPLAVRFKNELNENSKMIAKYEIIPEYFHNDIVGYEGSRGNFKVLILDPKDESIYTYMLRSFILNYLRDLEFKVLSLELKGSSPLTKLIYGSHIAGLLSVMIAKAKNINPLQTKSIDKYKEFLKTVFK
ncbi:MAG: bifunctional phosphoglucose/phosphomannose isomerase [Candidatus Methanomethylicia archaeon]